MILVVDAFNLIYKFPDLELCMYQNQLAEARRGLFQKLIQFQKLKKVKEIHVFLDGKKEKGSPVEFEELGQLNIYYSQDMKADGQIKKFIRMHLQPNNLYLVTSDKEILFYSKKYNCKYYTSEEFFKLYESTIKQAQEKELEEERVHKNLSNEEIREWIKFFKKNQKERKSDN